VGQALACHPILAKSVRNSALSVNWFGRQLSRPMAEYRRRLPHFHPDGEYLFVTWRLHGSLPVAPPDIVYATPGHAFAAQDRALALSHGMPWLSDTRVARQVAEAIGTGECRGFYELSAWVVMPNHVHMLILRRVALPQITHWIKGRTRPGGEPVVGAGGRTVLAARVLRSLGKK
jgi:hypothetical protein